MKSKPSKLMLIIAFYLVLIILNSSVFGIQNYSLQLTKSEENISQKSQSYEINSKKDWISPSDKKPKPYSVFESNWNFDEPKKWSEFAEVDDDSAELMIGINHAHANNDNELTNIIRKNNGKIVDTISMGGKIEAVVADIPLTSTSSFTKEIKAVGISSYIEPNFKFKANFIPNDPYWNQQWGPSKIGADLAWDTQLGNSSILVAIIDTGVDWNHSDLAANYVPLGYDWVNTTQTPWTTMVMEPTVLE